MKAVLLSILCSSVIIASEPRDITLTDGTVLKNATLTKSDPASASFLHEDGTARVPLGKLSEEDRASLNLKYEPQAAQEHATAERVAVAELATVQARKNIIKNLEEGLPQISGTYLSDTRNGVLVNLPSGRYTTETVHVVGNFPDFIEGEKVTISALEMGTFEYTTVLGAGRRVRQYVADLPLLADMIIRRELPGFSQLSQASPGPNIRQTGVPPIRHN